LAFGLCGTAAQAAVLVSNAPNLAYGTNMSFALVADDFSLGGTSDITGLRFWTLQSASTDYRGSVYWAIHGDSSGAPGAVLQSGTSTVAETPTGNTAGFGYDEYVIDIGVSFQLQAGTYWLALQNAPLGSSDPTEMLWEYSDTGGASGQYIDFQGDGASWLDAGANHAFEILGDGAGQVPEPATVVLLAGGLLAVRLVRRQRLAA
jgi:hypothetical protein